MSKPTADEPTPAPSEVADGDTMFSVAMENVAPLTKGRQQRRQRPQVTPTQLQRRAAAQRSDKPQVDPNFLTLGEVPGIQPLDNLEWKKDGVQRAVFAKLQRGGYTVEDSLDLHHKTVKEARHLTYAFIKRASVRGQRSLLISPGKGETSKTPGRLKSYVATWLQQHPEVIAFCSSQRQHGGVGSVYLLVRKSKESRETNRQQHGGKSEQPL